MNWLVMKLIFTIVPKRAPFLIRPVASLILGGLTKQLVDPNIEKAAEVVKLALEKHKGGWIAGGDAEGNPVSTQIQSSTCSRQTLIHEPPRACLSTDRR